MARTGVWRKQRRNLQRRNHPWMVFFATIVAIAVVWAVALRDTCAPIECAKMIAREAGIMAKDDGGGAIVAAATSDDAIAAADDHCDADDGDG